MPLFRFFVLCLSAGLLAPAGGAIAQTAAAPSSAPVLDFDYYKARIEPIFTTNRRADSRRSPAAACEARAVMRAAPSCRRVACAMRPDAG